MILQEDQIKDLIKKKEFKTKETLDLIETYVYEIKGKKLSEINVPKDFVNTQLMIIAQNKCIQYYTDKFYDY